MSLFQCENCGCCENTALAAQGFVSIFVKYFDWSYAPDLEGKQLCSACGPTHYSDGKKSEFGQWHGVFPRVFLPLGEFHTNQNGNLEHTATGSEDYAQFQIQQEQKQ